MANPTLSKLIIGGLAALALSCGPSAADLQRDFQRQTYMRDMHNPAYSGVKKEIVLHAINEILRANCGKDGNGHANEKGFYCVYTRYYYESSTGFAPGTSYVTTVTTQKSEFINTQGDWNTVKEIEAIGSAIFIDKYKKILTRNIDEANDLKQLIEVYLNK